MSTPKPRGARPRQAPQRRSSAPFVVVAAIAVVAVGIGVLMAGDDGGGDDGRLATAAVTVRGEPLPPLPPGGADPAVGTSAPTLEGVTTEGTPASVDFDGDVPTLLAFMAHWCPHCQAELPNLVTLADNGELDDLDAVVVLTATTDTRPNYPPAAWLDREGWEGRVLVDDADQPAAAAFGLTSFPYLVLVDADGEVIARSAGELGLEGLLTFIGQAGT